MESLSMILIRLFLRFCIKCWCYEVSNEV